ncbi:hypothetical protein J6590_049924 [Homalodisca vitripennis]|nr:hypothetical protein J6590_049924 [Homalodisca vitripennis]
MPAIWAELVLAHFQRLQTRNAAQDFGSVSPAQSAFHYYNSLGLIGDWEEAFLIKEAVALVHEWADNYIASYRAVGSTKPRYRWSDKGSKQ